MNKTKIIIALSSIIFLAIGFFVWKNIISTNSFHKSKDNSPSELSTSAENGSVVPDSNNLVVNTPTPPQSSPTPPVPPAPSATKTKTVKKASSNNIAIAAPDPATYKFVDLHYHHGPELVSAGYNIWGNHDGSIVDMRIQATPMYVPVQNLSPSRKDELEFFISSTKDRTQYLQSQYDERTTQIRIMSGILNDKELYASERTEYSDYLSYLNDRLDLINKTIAAWPAQYKAWQDELATL